MLMGCAAAIFVYLYSSFIEEHFLLFAKCFFHMRQDIQIRTHKVTAKVHIYPARISMRARMKSNCFPAISNFSTCNYLITRVGEKKHNTCLQNHIWQPWSTVHMWWLCRNLGSGIGGEGPVLLGNQAGKWNMREKAADAFFILRREQTLQASPSCKSLPAQNKKGCLSLKNHTHKHNS